jgi:flagellar biosynthesis/type III secretory pathway protein FliH
MTSLYRLVRGAELAEEPYPVAPDAAVRPGGAGRDEVDDQSGEDADMVKQAYQAGYQAGRTAASDEMGDRTTAAIDAFTSMVDDLSAQRRRLATESEAAVVRLACEVAARIVGKAAEINPEAVLQVVKSALGHLADKQKLTIMVNPEDRETLETHRGDWLASTGSGAVEIKEDARIKRGGCLVEGESGSVEAQIDRQIEVIEQAVLEASR